MCDKRTRVWVLAFLLLAAAGQADAASSGPRGDDAVISEVLRRLDALEEQNRGLERELAELRHENDVLRAASTATASTAIASASSAAATRSVAIPPAEWTSRLRFAGDFRFRHETIDVEQDGIDQARETIRARIGAAIRFGENLDGEIAFATGGLEPRGGSTTLGAASSRKAVGLDLGYARWRPVESLALTAGKMRQPFVVPSLSLFIDNEIRPEGVAVNYEYGGLSASAFGFWLEERPRESDSTLLGAQLGWSGTFERVSLKLGGAWFDYGGVQGRFPGFANSLVSEFGNSIVGSGPDARYVYDYDVGEVYAEASLGTGRLPLRFFADYARNFEADDGLDTAYSAGVVVGQAKEPGRWEAQVLTSPSRKTRCSGIGSTRTSPAVSRTTKGSSTACRGCR